MLDTGAQGEFMSPSLAKRLGATVEHGRFGVAVEAFGRETPLTQRVRRVELALPGQHPDSLLSQDFVTRWDFTISPGSLSDERAAARWRSTAWHTARRAGRRAPRQRAQLLRTTAHCCHRRSASERRASCAS